MIWQRHGRDRLVYAILIVALPFASSAASQLAPFFDGLKAIQSPNERNAYLKAQWLDPQGMIASEELPTILESLRDSDPSVSFLAGQYLSKLAFRHPINVRDQLQAAFPALAAHFDDPNTELPKGLPFAGGKWRKAVLDYLEEVYLPVPPEWIRPVELALYDPDSSVLAAHALARLKPMPPQVLHALLEKMDDPGDSSGKAAVLRGLGFNGVADPLVIQAIATALAGFDQEILVAAAAAAQGLGPPAKVVAPALRRALQEGRIVGHARESAQYSLSLIEQGHREMQPSVAELDKSTRADGIAELSKPDSMRVRSYFEMLMAAKPEERQKLVDQDVRRQKLVRTMVPAEDVPFLIEMLNSGEPDLAADASSHLIVMALENMGAGDKTRETIATAIPAMSAHYDDGYAWKMDVLGLASIIGATPTPDLVSKMLSALADGDNLMAEFAAKPLAGMKPLPKDILTALLARLKRAGGDPEIIRALLSNKVYAPEFAQALAALLDEPTANHFMAAMALSQMGSAAKPAEPALRRFLSRETTPESEEATAQAYARLALKNLSDR